MIGERTYNNKARSEDIACLLMARLGFSRSFIHERTGLSEGAISYRLKMLNVRIADYRNGHSDLSVRIANAATRDAKEVVGLIRKQISERAGA